MRSRRYLVIAAAIAAALLVIALVTGRQLRDGTTVTAIPSAAPTPSATSVVAISSATPTASATSSPCVGPCGGATGPASSGPTTAIYNDDFGFVVSGGDGPPHASIRKESGYPGTGTQFAPQTLAVSPDGTQIAFWAMYTATPELHLLSAGTGPEQTLVTLTTDQRGGGIVWSSDGAGLLYSTEKGNIGVGGGPPNSATLNVYELAATGHHGTTIDTQTDTGWIYRPIAWDRSLNFAAAGLTGNGAGFSFYVTVRINADNTFTRQQVDTRSRSTFGMSMGSIHASSDAKFVLGVDADSGDIKWWPLADVAASKSQAGAGKRGALWRPGTHEIGFIGPSDQFWLGNVDTAGPLGLCCTAFSGAPAGSTLRMFRADGTGVVLVAAAANPFLASYTLVRLGSDPKATSGDRVTFQDLSGLLASARLR